MISRYFYMLLAVCLIFTVSLISAQDADFVYKGGEQIDIRVPCLNNGTYCSGSAVCNLTMIYSNGSYFLNGVKMTNQGSSHNYTLSKSNTWVYGIYPTTISCTDGSFNGAWSYYSQITPSGENAQLGFYFLGIGLAIVLLIFGYMKEDYAITILGTFALYFVGLYILFNGLDIYKNSFTNALAIIILGIAGYITTMLGIDYLNQI